MGKKHFILFLLLSQSFYALAQVRVNGGSQYQLNGHVYLFAEGSSPSSVSEMLPKFRNGEFEVANLTRNAINLGFTQKIYWVGFTFFNETSKPINMEAGVANGGLYHLEYYLVNKNGRVTDSVVTGEYYDYYTRVIKSRHYYFPVLINPGEEYTVLFRADMRGNSFHFPVRLVTPVYRENEEKNQYIFYAFFCGLLAFVAFFSFITSLWVKNLTYLFYSLYVGCNCLLFLADGDLDFELLYPHWPALATITPAIYGCGIVLFVLQFMNRFLLLKTSRPVLYKLSQFWSVLVLALLAVIPFSYNYNTSVFFRTVVFYFGSVCIIGGWLLQVYCIAVRIKDRFQPAYLYGIAIITVFISATLYILNSYSIINFSSLTFNYILVGFTAEIIVLSFALMYNYNYSLKKNRELSNTIALQQLEFSNQLIQTQEEERSRLARDLHDDLGATLSTLKLHLSNPPGVLQAKQEENKYVEKGVTLISKATDDLRQISHDLLPNDFIEQGLFDVLKQRISSINANGNTRFSLILEGDEKKLESITAITLYRVINEMISNIIHHAQASEATVQLSVLDQGIQLIVEDNGIGFTPGQHSKGIGMKNIHSRVGFLKGTVNIDSSKQGTTFIIDIPIKNNHE